MGSFEHYLAWRILTASFQMFVSVVKEGRIDHSVYLNLLGLLFYFIATFIDVSSNRFYLFES